MDEECVEAKERKCGGFKMVRGCLSLMEEGCDAGGGVLGVERLWLGTGDGGRG